MKRIAARLRTKRGFSFAELLIVLAIFALIGASIAIGLTAAMRAYNDVRASSEASVLCQTLTGELTDALRNATNISDDGKNAVFTSRRFGANAVVEANGGYITVGGYELLSEKAYMGLSANANVRFENGRFTLKIEVFRDSQVLAEAALTITPLNS